MRNIIIAVMAFAIVGCASGPHKYEYLDTLEAAQMRNAKNNATRQEAIAFLNNASDAQIMDALTEQLTDLTAIINQSGHGTYVEYTNPEGRLFMWYPGNPVTVKGNWGVKMINGSPRACFNYKGAYHGVTGEYEPSECVSPRQTLASTSHIADFRGDVFNLGSGKIPYMKSYEGIPALPSEYDAIDAKIAKAKADAKAQK